ncbi:hypothetical protein Tco_0968001 [Tanacetum coccineum]
MSTQTPYIGASPSHIPRSFASVLKSNQPNNLSSSNMIHDASPAIALDDDCLSANDLSCVAIGKIKDINALSNLSVILNDEGFDDIKISYLGGYWVLIQSILVWIAIEGLPMCAWNNKALSKIVSPWGTLTDCRLVERIVQLALQIKEEFYVYVWGSNSLVKVNATNSDYFMAVVSVNVQMLLFLLRFFGSSNSISYGVKLMGIGVSNEEVLAAANIIGCSTFSTPFSYLGVKVGMSPSRRIAWDEIIAPLGVLRDLEFLRRKFFNGADINEKRFSMISWNKILASKQKGGLENPRGGAGRKEQLHHLVELVGSISLSPSNDRWAWLLGSSETGDRQLTRLDVFQETNDKITTIKERLKTARNRQKSYVDNHKKPIEFQIGDQVLLKVPSWKGMIRFGKRDKLNPRYTGAFKVLSIVGPVTYQLKLPQKLRGIHDVFHVSNLKKCLTDEMLVVPLRNYISLTSSNS